MSEFPPRDKTPEENLRGWARAYREGPAEYRFPSDPHAEFFPDDMERGADEIAALRQQLAEAREALDESRIAIDDWLNTYASEHCNAERVAEAWGRISERGGTLHYIATVQEKNRTVLRALKEQTPSDAYHSFFEPSATKRVEVKEKTP